MEKKQNEIEALIHLGSMVFWGLCLYVILTQVGCTTGGGKVCFGYEEVNQIKNESGYTIPKREK